MERIERRKEVRDIMINEASELLSDLDLNLILGGYEPGYDERPDPLSPGSIGIGSGPYDPTSSSGPIGSMGQQGSYGTGDLRNDMGTVADGAAVGALGGEILAVGTKVGGAVGAAFALGMLAEEHFHIVDRTLNAAEQLYDWAEGLVGGPGGERQGTTTVEHVR